MSQSVDTNLFDRVSARPYNLSTGQLVIGSRSALPEQAHPFRFLSVFKWEARKGWPELLSAYAEEFRVRELTHPVTLAMLARVPP